MEKWQELAITMVEEQVAPQGIHDTSVLEAMKRVPRHLFIPEIYQTHAYEDYPLPIGEEQTISQPFIVAKMTELLNLKKGDRVLEIGTGSGYQAAILAEMGMKVTTIERIEELARKAKNVFHSQSYDIHSIIGDGREGYSRNAPYSGIIVTAGAPEVEEAWLHQLRDGGRIVVPVAVQDGIYCLLVRYKTGAGSYEDTWIDYCRFVPLLKGVKSNPQANL